MINFISEPFTLLFLVLGLLVAITVHEFMHAWTANYFGDPTSKYMGRISLNPLHHLDPLGTLAIFLIGIGWGKPVQINERNFKNPRLDSAVVSVAGPLSNLAVAILFSIPVFLNVVSIDSMMYVAFFMIVRINILLMIFNLIPIPPLDGSKVLYYFLPKNVDIVKLETYGPMILLGLIAMQMFAGVGIFSFIINISSIILKALGFSF